MSSGGGELSNLGIALVIIFAVSLLAISAQIIYVLWRRLAFRRRTSAAGGGGDEVPIYSSSESGFVAPSKELLYCFCIRPQCCLDRRSLTANSGDEARDSNRESDVEVIDIDLLKIQGMFGPPRFLFTIKEEEREDMESPALKTAPCPAENEMMKIVGDDEERESVSLEECFRSAEDTVVEVEVEVESDDGSVDDDDATPFSTPCASPVYFTPSASPIHEHDAVNGRSGRVATMAACRLI